MKKLVFYIKNRLIIISLITAYCLFLGAIIIYFGFPYTKAVKWIVSQADNQPGITVSYHSMEKKFSNSNLVNKLKITNTYRGVDYELVNIPRAYVSINPLGLFLNKVGIRIKGNPYKGDLDARINRGIINQRENSFNTSIMFNNIDLSQHPDLNTLKLPLTGIFISGYIYLKVGDSFQDASGNAELVSTNGKIDLSRVIPFLGIPITYDVIKLETELIQGVLHVRNLVLKGKDIEAKITGILNINFSSPKYSQLDLKGFYKPVGEQVRNMSAWLTEGKELDTVPFVIKGTIARPRFTVKSSGIQSSTTGFFYLNKLLNGSASALNWEENLI